MGNGLPRQLRWADFVRALERLGYRLFRSGSGAARTFRKPGGHPELVTFHEPHGADTLRIGTLRAYLRKLGISVSQFLDVLEK